METTWTELASALGVEIHDLKLWREAVTHPSYLNEKSGSGRSYERLEFLGDAVLGAAVAHILHGHHPDSPPGELTFLRSVLVRREHLARFARTLPLEPLLRVGRGARALDKRGLDTIYADIAEALIAAVYLEHGFDAVMALVRRHIAADIPGYLEARLVYEPKNVLQEMLATDGIEAPVYEVIEEASGTDEVLVRVAWNGGEARATARSKREAGVQAARRAVGQLLQAGAA